MKQKALVTVLIPTHNRPHFVFQAIESVLNQTHQNFEIIISDDSDTDETKALMKPYLKDRRIKYYFNKGFSASENGAFLWNHNNLKAEYINWLMDDDLFAPQKLEKMIEVYENYPEVTLVTSGRNVIDKRNNIQSVYTMKNNDSSFYLDGSIIASTILQSSVNIVGELTTVLLKKEYLRYGFMGGWYDGSEISVLNDVATHLMLLSKGKFFYINEQLSSFRKHAEQSQVKPEVVLECMLEWQKLLRYAWKNNIFISNNDIYIKLGKFYVERSENFINNVPFNKDVFPYIEELANNSVNMLNEIFTLETNK